MNQISEKIEKFLTESKDDKKKEWSDHVMAADLGLSKLKAHAAKLSGGFDKKNGGYTSPHMNKLQKHIDGLWSALDKIQKEHVK
jgi:hypothetical protein